MATKAKVNIKSKTTSKAKPKAKVASKSVNKNATKKVSKEVKQKNALIEKFGKTSNQNKLVIARDVNELLADAKKVLYDNQVYYYVFDQDLLKSLSGINLNDGSENDADVFSKTPILFKSYLEAKRIRDILTAIRHYTNLVVKEVNLSKKEFAMYTDKNFADRIKYKF